MVAFEMSKKYFEAISGFNKVVFDDVRGRYIKTREIKATDLKMLTNDYSYGITASYWGKLYRCIPEENKLDKVCVLECPILEHETITAISTDLYDDYIGYAIKQKNNESGKTYIYIICGVLASTNKLEEIASHLKISMYADLSTMQGNYGIQVFDGCGNITLNSNDTIMSIVNAVNETNITNGERGDMYFKTSITRSKVPNSRELCEYRTNQFCSIQTLPGAFFEAHDSGGGVFPMSGYITFSATAVKLHYFIGRVIFFMDSYKFGYDLPIMNEGTNDYYFFITYNNALNIFILRN